VDLVFENTVTPLGAVSTSFSCDGLPTDAPEMRVVEGCPFECVACEERFHFTDVSPTGEETPSFRTLKVVYVTDQLVVKLSF
jgi:hypothetical protein